MQITPTDKGAGFAGIMLASIAWLSAFKMDHVFRICRIDRFCKMDRAFDWIIQSYSNKALTLLFTEVVNFTVHGVTNPASVLFAVGSTIVNAFMIFIGLPLRKSMKKEAVTI